MATILRRGNSKVLCYSENGRRRRKSLGNIPDHIAERVRKEKEAQMTLAKLGQFSNVISGP